MLVCLNQRSTLNQMQCSMIRSVTTRAPCSSSLISLNLQRDEGSSGRQSPASPLPQTSILPTPARTVCRTSCSHAGVTESCLGRSRLLPNCAFQSCCALGVTTGLHAVWGHSRGRGTDGIQPSRVSLIC